MRRPVFRSTFLLLVLAAMLVRGVLPAGWMPGSAPGTLFVICTLSGPVHIYLDTNGKPVKQDSGHSKLCPFGTAPHFATPNVVVTALTGMLHATDVALPTAFERLSGKSSLSAHAPRAPPTLV